MDMIRKYVEKKQGLKKALESFKRDYNIVLIAPTAYGKTLLSLLIYDEGKKQGISPNLIHVVPLRALVQEIFMEKFKPFLNISGWQMHGELLREHKSPYYLRDLVVTTLDSFIYNLYKIPVAEIRKIIKGVSQGHYYAVLASIYTSTIVFDEAQFYLDDTEHSSNAGLQAMYAALEYIAMLNNPIIIETATLCSTQVKSIVNLLARSRRKVKVIYVGSAQENQLRFKLGQIAEIDFVNDDYFSSQHRYRWKTNVVVEHEALKIAGELCKTEPILIVRNTVKKAIETYKYLENKCDETVLIHGLLSNVDKEHALRNAREILGKRAGLIVSTQIVEAGVEIGGSILITDRAPIPNLAQRAGRLCRETHGYNKKCIDEEARVIIIADGPTQPYPHDLVEESLNAIINVKNSGRDIDWRLLENSEERTSFAYIMENIKGQDTGTGLHEENMKYRKLNRSNLFRYYLESDAQPFVLIDILRDLGVDLIDRGALLTILIPSDGIEHDNEVEIVSVDAWRLLQHEVKYFNTGKECLQYQDEKPLLVIKSFKNNKASIVINSRLKITNLDLRRRDSINMYLIEKLLSPDTTGTNVYSVTGEVYLLAKKECYEKEMGLKIWE